MTDSPARYPANPAEAPILDELYRIRNHLELLSTDKSCFIKAPDVKQCYNDIIPQVHALNDLRAGNLEQQTQVDVVLDDCFQLISLAFLTIGKNSELPAIYSVVSAIKRLLDHLSEAAFYTKQDLKSCQRHLSQYRETLKREKDKHDPHIVTHLESRITACEVPLGKLIKILDLIPEDLVSTYERLVSILRLLCSFNLRSKFPHAEVAEIIKELKEIQAKLGEPDPIEGTIELAACYAKKIQNNLDNTPVNPTDGRKIVTDLLARNILWSHLMEKRPAFIAEGFTAPFKKLLEIRNNLERRYLVQTWSIRETDLYIFQRQLTRLDDTRNQDGNFVDAEGTPADLQTQRTLLYLLRKSYVLIYRMLTSSKPVSEALLPIYNQLKTLLLCLKEVEKAGGVSSPRELYPYTMKLASIQNLQTNGTFIINDDIPDGQDVCRAMLAECSQTLRELAAAANSAKKTDSEDNMTTSPVSLKA